MSCELAEISEKYSETSKITTSTTVHKFVGSKLKL